MRTFATYIEYLLMTRHYCYVPGRGAYMLVDESASFTETPGLGTDSRRLHTIAAPHRIVRFSPLLSHDDGMLANLLMEAEGMTFDEACRYIQRQAPLLTDDFLQSASLHTDADNFGFEHLYVEKWKDIEMRLTKTQQDSEGGKSKVAGAKRGDIVEIPKYWLKRAAVAMLIGVFFFTNFIGLNRGTAQLAGVIDMNAIQRNSIIHQTWDEEDELVDLTDEATIDAADNALIETAISESMAEMNAQRQTVMVATVPVSPVDIQEDPIEAVAPGTTYFIVGFCTWTEKYANEVLNRYKSYGYKNAGILVTKDLYRVFVDRFSDKEEALNYLYGVRKENVRLSKSWLLPFENNGSLSSYIIKNIYNDNQLSMELSHPHQRTERDQG